MRGFCTRFRRRVVPWVVRLPSEVRPVLSVHRSVFPRLEPLLPTVQKPIQYVGGELNSTVKEWDCALEGPTSAGR